MPQTSPAAAHQTTRFAQASEPRPQAAQAPIILLRNLEKTYTTARGALTLFRGLNLVVQPGEMVAIVDNSVGGPGFSLRIAGPACCVAPRRARPGRCARLRHHA